jgi:hypothetical protein
MKLVSTCWAVLLPTRQVGDGQEIRARTDKGIIIAGRRTNRVQPYDSLVTGRDLLTNSFTIEHVGNSKLASAGVPNSLAAGLAHRPQHDLT